MDSNLLAKIHLISAQLFLLTYLIKTVLLFTSKEKLMSYSKATKVPEMIISTLFLVTGIWLLAILGGIKVFQIIKIVLVLLAIPVAVVGFKKMKKGLALLSLLLIIGAYGLGEMSKNKPFIPAKVVVNGEATGTANGAAVYMANCAFCHGADGKKQYRGARDLTMSSLDEGGITKIVNEGIKGKMPAYKMIISDQNIADLSAYVTSMHVSSNLQSRNSN